MRKSPVNTARARSRQKRRATQARTPGRAARTGTVPRHHTGLVTRGGVPGPGAPASTTTAGADAPQRPVSVAAAAHRSVLVMGLDVRTGLWPGGEDAWRGFELPSHTMFTRKLVLQPLTMSRCEMNSSNQGNSCMEIAALVNTAYLTSSVSQPGATPVGSVFFSKLTRRLRGNKFSTPACSTKTIHSKLKHR
jgi:hypothetical protein